ncbi:MAG: hypothetical protein ABI640_04185 [Gammaproteobacteria bacterium]
MSSQPTAAAALTMDRNAAAETARTGYFFWMSALLLTFVLVGFTPTLYLRAFFPVEPVPSYLFVHGGILTAWFTWLVVQTALVRKGNTATHRRLGVIGAIIGVAVVVAGPMAPIGVVGRIHAALDWDADMSAIPELGIQGVTMVQFIAQVVWGNFVSIAVFAGMLVAAVLLRRTPPAHKRLMLLASIVIVGPALARISRWPMLGGEAGPFIPVMMVGLVLSVVAHDLVIARRLHRTTVIGVGVIVLGEIAHQLIARSEFGQSVIRMLG